MLLDIDGYLIDAVLSEEHVREAEITEFPVETGSPVTDHRRRRPVEVTIEFVVSDSPIGEAVAARARAFEDGGLGQGVLPSEDVRFFFESLDERGEPVTIITKLGRDYDDMVLQSLNIPVTPDNDGLFECTAVFRQITFVENRRVFVDVIEPRGAKKRNLGAKQGAQIIGPTTVDSATGRNIQYIRSAPGEEGRFWYASDSGVPIRELSQEELDDMNTADIANHEDFRHNGSDWIDTRTGRPVPQSAVPAGRYPGDPEDIRNRSRVGNPWFVGTGRGQ